MELVFIEPFKIATNNVLTMMAATQINFEEPVVRNSKEVFGIVTGIIGMTAEGYNGNLMISFDLPCLLGVVEGMLGEKFDGLTPEVVDVVGEITNMVCGGAKAIFSEKGLVFDMASPAIVVGEKVEISQSRGHQVISVKGKTSRGSFVIESSISDKK